MSQLLSEFGLCSVYFLKEVNMETRFCGPIFMQCFLASTHMCACQRRRRTQSKIVARFQCTYADSDCSVVVLQNGCVQAIVSVLIGDEGDNAIDQRNPFDLGSE